MKRTIIIMVFLALMAAGAPADASVILNEILSDPASGLTGDANGDGVRSGTNDEFIELLNNGSTEEDISGWLLADGVSTRHIFPSDTILSPYAFLVVFGGGSPVLPGVNWQTASTGSLGLNNTNDAVSLFDADTQLIDRIAYGSIGGHDQSFTLFPDGQGADFVLHSSAEQSAGALFSPGMTVDARVLLVEKFDENDGEESPDNTVVPEIPTMLYFAMGWGSLLLKKKF